VIARLFKDMRHADYDTVVEPSDSAWQRLGAVLVDAMSIQSKLFAVVQ
jgi:hypothetical protein